MIREYFLLCPQSSEIPNHFSKFCLWWTEEDYKAVPTCKKILYFIFRLHEILSICCHLVYCARHPQSKPVAIMVQDIGHCLTELAACSSAFLFPYNRKRTSNLLKAVNDMNRDILRRQNKNSRKNRRYSNRLFQRLSLIGVVYLISGVMFSPLFFVEFAKTGLPYLRSDFYHLVPFSVLAHTINVFQICTDFWLVYLVLTLTAIYCELLLRIAFHFRVTAQELRQLRKGVNFDEEVEFSKLKKLINDVNLLHG